MSRAKSTTRGHRLVVVSNRVTPVTGNKSAQAGGLAVGLLDALKASGGLWFGWSGEISEAPPKEARSFTSGRITYVMSDLAQRDYEEYYEGFANRTLWPLFHYRLDLSSFENVWHIAYKRVNQQFADHLLPHLKDDDVVWLHDYHLLFLGEMLRKKGFKGKIGFFLHIPFPSSDVFLALPRHREFAIALSYVDLIGFQSNDDLRNFGNYIEREELGTVDMVTRTVRVEQRSFRVNAYPIGIDADGFAEMAKTSSNTQQVKRFKSSLNQRKLIIGVDRLDYSKGINNRLLSYEMLLQNYPQHRGQVTYVQISAPSRENVPEYIEIRRAVEGTAGRINGRYADFDWEPLRYINRSFPRRTLAGIFRMSAVALVTPLRDGMNLVAKEFVAAQELDDPGVLVLSRFAGAREQFRGGALIVNPFDTEEVADKLNQALEMPLEERQERWQVLSDNVNREDIKAWREAFLRDLIEPAEMLA